MKTAIAVEDTRSTLARLTATTADGGYRVVIVDAVDDLNASSANALLKMLEEPPGKTVFLLIGHRPGAVMPTIRSRCRSLILRALDTDLIVRQLVSEGGISRDVAQTAAALCGGSLRRAIELSEERNQKLATRLLGLLSRLPSRDPGEMHAFSDSIAQGGEEAQDLMLDLIGDWLHRRITGATEPVAFGAPVARPPLAQWSEVWDKLNRLSEETDTYNLDRKTFVMLTIEELAAACR